MINLQFDQRQNEIFGGLTINTMCALKFAPKKGFSSYASFYRLHRHLYNDLLATLNFLFAIW